MKNKVIMTLLCMLVFLCIGLCTALFIFISRDKADEKLTEWYENAKTEHIVEGNTEESVDDTTYTTPESTETEFKDDRFTSVDEEFDYSYDNLGFRLRRFLVMHFGEDFTCEMVDGGDMACTYLINGDISITYYAGDDSVEFEGNRYYLSEQLEDSVE